MNDFAVAISVGDDQRADARRLVEAIRSDWKGKYALFLCAPPTQIVGCEGLAVDGLVPLQFDGADIRHNPQYATLHHNLVAIEGLRQVCRAAAHSETSWTLHLRAGDPLCASHTVAQLGAAMRQRGKVFAARGVGFGYYAHDCPVGQFDASSFFFDNAFARARHLWDFRAIDLLPHKVSVNGFLALWILARIGVRRFWRYAGQPPLGADLNGTRRSARQFLREYIVRRWIYRYRYGDIIWPRPLTDCYPESLGNDISVTACTGPGGRQAAQARHRRIA